MIAVLGAYGAVGRAAAAELTRTGAEPVRVGGRDPERLGATARELGAEPYPVDLTDPDALAGFCTGASVVVNGAGPAHRVLDTVARAAAAAGSHYVDPAGDDDLAARVAASYPEGADRAAVLSAGMLPGLSGLLPRHVAAGFDAADRLHAYLGGRSALTPAAAADFLLSAAATEGKPLTGWSGGHRALRPLREVELPFFPGRVTATPHLTPEIERVARALGLAEAHWFTVFVGEQATALLARHTAGAATGSDDPVAAFGRAVGVDLAGHDPYQVLACQIEGTTGDRREVRTLTLRVDDGYALSGTTAAFTATQAAAGRIGGGTAHLAAVADPAAAVAWLSDSPVVRTLTVVDGLPMIEDRLRAGEDAAGLFEDGEL
ncbi:MULTISPECIES: saccharopine dehydrogenase NADP-binding domain-containing protein [Pseudonocardia]|uniref:Saccharopine dehydrogenase n=2 Tax=Pseudonocardia TaxID=1847 RepID=A0A1Y2N064_PSEAH|nr:MULTISPECIES: saccharopine dehydrogenase NADP-binding domain-containing protein [Pseudonocardia]OSY40835.1 Saccharopine dehydrogenase [Pseudonocardia autotrophica]TDN71857.1 saccharopine dehydrogenase-like protein [Pseudonocardia autotrophica]BBG02545.1 hypothetical protein Pdca_37540 [Pseudonocardia autotrophica]GEC29308.1 hypothetical protein PSA01_63370 [Pseudonocardia saturnea]